MEEERKIMSGSAAQQPLLDTPSAVIPESPILAAARAIPPKTVEELQAQKDALMQERTDLISKHNEAIQVLQTKANQLSEAHNTKVSKINTHMVELQGAIKLLSGEL